MTSFVVWVGADSRGPSSLNIASDSRISWAGPPKHAWDQGKKIYASSGKPLLIGFTGDVPFPALILPGLMDRIDRGVVPNGIPLSDYIYSALRAGWDQYPQEERRQLNIFICHREHQGMKSKFRLFRMSVTAKLTWYHEEIQVPESSQVLIVDGSGKEHIKSGISDWQTGPTQNTSRAVFSGFVEGIVSGTDPQSGGSPQLGSIYRIGTGRIIGVVHERERYFAGMRLLGNEEPQGVEWRNALFERADGASKKRLPGAQRHLRPSGQ